MKNIDLIRAMEYIDPEYVKEAGFEKRAAIIPLSFQKALAAVACFAIIVGISFVVAPMFMRVGDANMSPDAAPPMNGDGGDGAGGPSADGSTDNESEGCTKFIVVGESEALGNSAITFLSKENSEYVFELERAEMDEVCFINVVRKGDVYTHELVGIPSNTCCICLDNANSTETDLFDTAINDAPGDEIPAGRSKISISLKDVVYENDFVYFGICFGEDVIRVEVDR